MIGNYPDTLRLLLVQGYVEINSRAYRELAAGTNVLTHCVMEEVVELE